MPTRPLTVTRLKPVTGLHDQLKRLEARIDDEIAIPNLIQGYITLAEATQTTPEKICEVRTGRNKLPSIAKLIDPDLEPEWIWTSRFAKQFQAENVSQVVIKVFDINEIESFEDGFTIEIEVDRGTIGCIYPISEVIQQTAVRIAEIMAHCFSYNGIEVVENHWSEEEQTEMAEIES